MPPCAVTEKEIIIKKRVTIDFIADDLGHEYTEIPHYCNAVYRKQVSGIITGDMPGGFPVL